MANVDQPAAASSSHGSKQIHPTALLCGQASINGNVTIGAETIIHPTCHIEGLKGPIVIGEQNVFEEQVEIINTRSTPLTIGNKNWFEVGAKIFNAKSIGDLNVFRPKCDISEDVVVKNGCTIGAATQVPSKSVLENQSVLYGSINKICVDDEALAKNLAAINFDLPHLSQTLKNAQ